MAIIYRKEKREIAPWIVGIMLLVTTALALHMLAFFSVRVPKPEGDVVFNTETKIRLELLRRGIVSSQYTLSEYVATRPVQQLQKDDGVVDDGISHVAPPTERFALPPYGADAIGAPGAWDGQTEDGVSTVSETDDGKDQFGNPCIRDVRSIDSAILRNMIPPPPVKDKCSYRYVYLSRTTTPPADVLLYGTDATFGIEEISGYMKSGLWSIADFEGLAQFHLAPRGALTLYLMLRSVGSPVATYLQNRKDHGIERGYIDDFLKSGECPDKSETIENYCQ